MALFHQRWVAHAGLQSSVRLIGCVIATVIALVSAGVVAPCMILPALPTSYADPAPDSAVPAEFYWHCPVHAGTTSIPSINVLITATLTEWLRLPIPVRVPLIPQDVSAMASAEL